MRFVINRSHRGLVSWIAIAFMLMMAIPMLGPAPASAANIDVSITKIVCPDDGTDWSAATFSDIINACSDAGSGYPFTIIPDAGEQGEASTDSSGFVSWSLLPEGGGAIYETSSSGMTARVACAVYDTGSTPSNYSEYDASGNAISYSLSDNQSLDCAWYNLPTSASGTTYDSTVSVNKYVCPLGYDMGSGGLAELQADCTDVMTDVGFTLLPSDGSESSRLTDVGGQAYWQDVASGPLDLIETPIPDGYGQPRVYCASAPIAGGGDNGYYEQTVDSNGSLSFDLASASYLECFWYNGGATTGNSSILIYKVECDESYDWSSADLQTLYNDCGSNRMEGVDFELLSGNGSEQSTSDNNGIAGWSNVPIGDATILETVPSGYGPPRVFCGSAPSGDAVDNFDELETDANGTVTLPVSDDTYNECWWFNQKGTPQQIIVNKFSCPDDYDWSTAKYNDLTAKCTTPQKDVQFRLADQSSSVKGITDKDGLLSWTIVEPGSYGVSETIPDGYGQPVVLCASYPTDAPSYTYKAATVKDGGISVEVDPGYSVSCVWFNKKAPGLSGPATLIINKYTCPAGYEVFDDDSNPYDDCNIGTEDIDFSLIAVGDDSGAGASTGEGGKPATIKFSDIDPGSYLLSEDMPDDIDWAFITGCSSNARNFSSYPFYPFATITPEGTVEVSLVAGETLECDWFNVLAPKRGTLTVVKYWCPSQVVNKSNCEIYPDGVAFTLTDVDSGDETPLLTDENGEATAEVEGTFELIEDDFTWCSAESDYVNNDGQIEIGSGDDAVVTIYNCGPQPGS